MAGIVVKPFGGIMPAVDARDLPRVGGAAVANNLDMAWGDFRPLPTDGGGVASVENGARSIFRTPDTGTWLSSLQDVNYVRSQINDDPTERIFLTGRNDYPEYWQGGEYRRLGVPSPATAPVATVTTKYDPYTADERADDIDINLLGGMVSAARASLNPITWVGALDSSGLTQWTTANGFDQDFPQYLVYGQEGNGTAIIDATNKAWVLDPDLDGFWALGGNYYCIPIHAYGYFSEIDPTSFANRLREFYRPRGPAAGDQLFTEAQITDLNNAVANYLDPDDEYMVTRKGRLTEIVSQFKKLLQTGHDPGLKDAVERFYQTATVQSEINSVIDSVCSEVLDQLDAAYAYQPNYNPGGF